MVHHHKQCQCQQEMHGCLGGQFTKYGPCYTDLYTNMWFCVGGIAWGFSKVHILIYHDHYDSVGPEHDEKMD